MQIGEISNETQQIPVSEPILFYLGLLEYFLLGFSDPANLLEQYCLEKHHVRFLFFYQKVRINLESVQFSSVQSLSRVRLFATSWIAARQASLSNTNSWS